MEKTTETTMIENTTSNLEGEEARREAAAQGKLDEINRDMAKRGTATEHKIGAWEAMKIYRKGAFWSIFISLSIIMRAYDIEIMGNFYALPAFQQHFGVFYKGHGYQIPAAWVTLQFLQAKSDTDIFQASSYVHGLFGRTDYWGIHCLISNGDLRSKEDFCCLSYSHWHPHLHAILRLHDWCPHSISISLGSRLGWLLRYCDHLCLRGPPTQSARLPDRL
jgi:hypothetical protein